MIQLAIPFAIVRTAAGASGEVSKATPRPYDPPPTIPRTTYRSPVRPFLLLDVDGPLNPREPSAEFVRHEIVEGDRSWTVHLNPSHGAELRDLVTTFDLVWASSWEQGANRLLAPLLGLPQLPTIEWPDRTPIPTSSWKTPYVAAWVGERPFVWLDDGVDERDIAYFARPCQLVHRVDSQTGLTPGDFAVVRAWQRENLLR
nr:HAD domain-containing protein [Kribbella sandramycini]